MQNDATSIRTFRTGLLARRAGFATAAHASTTGKSEDPTAAARGAFAPKSKNLEEASSSAAMEKSSFAALSVLSGATGAGPSTTTTTNSSVTRPVAVPRRDDRDNPFLQRPARKLFKHDTMSHGDTPSTSAGATTSTTSNTTANKATSNSLFSMPHSGKSTKTVAPKPNTERLTLTRVMPLNSPTKPGARSTVSVTRHQEKEADRPTAFSLFGQLSAPSKMTTPATLSGNIVQEAHGSTTPTMTPNPKYFEALDMNQAVPVPKLDFSGLEKGKGSPILRRTDLDLPDKGQEEEKGPAGTAASATYSSTTLAFARKSIMKHARAKPQTVLQSVARAAEEHEGSPLYSTLLSASTYAPRFESSPPTSATSQALAVNTPAVSNSSSKPPTALSSNSATTSKWPTTATSQKNSDTSLRPTPTAPAPAPTPAPAPIRESRAVLDFSGRTEPEKTTATATQTVPVTTRPGSLESQEQHEKPSVANEHPSTAEKTGHSQSRFDLRAALLSESSRSKYELPALTAREAPELTGRASKTAPYQVPSAEERRELRANRRPGYKALPLNPKIFTSAGDLGVPRIPKAPLTVPRSPKFSKIRSRHPTVTSAAATSAAGPIRSTITSRVAELVRHGGHDGPRSVPTHVTGLTSATAGATGSAKLSSFAYTRPTAFSGKFGGTIGASAQSDASHEPTRRTEPQPSKDETMDVQSNSALENRMHGGPSKTTTAHTTTASNRPYNKRPLTQPIPFKFATDSLLRKRTAYEPTSVTSFRLEHVKPSDSRPPKPPPAPYQRPLKRLTIPKPFTFQTDLRAEVHHSNFRQASTEHQQRQQLQHQRQHPMHGVVSRELLPSRPSRLSNLLPVARPTTVAATAANPRATTPMRHQPFLRPPRITVPISPKLGRNPEVRVVRPMIPFIPKKSTKELTQPVGFRFTTDDRLEIRRAHYDADAEDKERKVIEARMARQQALDQKLATRERFESTFRARPIAHYPPIHIRPAKKALTVPVSPLIGDKRKRYEAALRFAAAQDTGGDEVEYSDGMFQRDYRGAGEQIENSETYRQFEEGRLMQEQQESLKRQLKDQEIRQLELANSSHANVQQPPLRISFPFDPETQAIQQEDNVVVDISIEDLHTEEYQEEEEQQQQQQQQQQQFRIGRTLPTSQAARRTSSGIGNKRVSLTTSKVIESGSPRRMSGRARRTSRESSPEHDHNTPSKASVYEPYYAFSRSMERTADLETAKDKTVVGAAVPRAEESSAENDSHGKGDRSTPPADVDRSSLEQRNQRPDTATVLESTAAVDDFLVADGLPKQQPEDNDPDRRRSGSFFPLDRDTRPALPNTTGATASRRISMGVNDDPDRRRSGSFIPLLEATTATKTNVQDKGKKKEATLATALKAKQPVSALITGAAQRHRLPIPSNPMRGRILPGTLGV